VVRQVVGNGVDDTLWNLRTCRAVEIDDGTSIVQSREGWEMPALHIGQASELRVRVHSKTGLWHDLTTGQLSPMLPNNTGQVGRLSRNIGLLMWFKSCIVDDTMLALRLVPSTTEDSCRDPRNCWNARSMFRYAVTADYRLEDCTRFGSELA
jgi:hypothetical protein